jgi:hypothetical protein
MPLHLLVLALACAAQDGPAALEQPPPAQQPLLPPDADAPAAPAPQPAPAPTPAAPEGLPPPAEDAPSSDAELVPDTYQELDTEGVEVPKTRKKKKVREPPAEEQDLPPMPISRLRPELLTMGITSAVPLVLWLPTFGFCCASSVMLALVLPVSGFDPTAQFAGGQPRFWSTLCWLGCSAGCLGWLVSMPTAAVSGVLATLVGMIGGVSVGIARMPGQWLRSLTAGAAALVSGVLATVVSVGVVGGITLAYGFGMYFLANQFQTTAVGRRTVRLWWTGLNITMVAGLIGVLGVMAAGAALPPLAATSGYAAVRVLFHRISTPEDLPADE